MNTIHVQPLARTISHPPLIDDLVSRILEAIFRRSYQTSTDFSQFDLEIPRAVNPCDWLETTGVNIIQAERRQRMLSEILKRGRWDGSMPDHEFSDPRAW